MVDLKKSLKTFMKKNQHFFDDPLIQSFLGEEENKKLLLSAVEQDDKDASATLDKRFEVFYLKVRMIHYLNKLARFYGQTYDKKKRKQQVELTFDAPVDADGESMQTMGELVPATEFPFDDLCCRSVQDLLPIRQMATVFQSFSEQKKTVINLYTFGQLTNKEIAERLLCTPQNVSKMKARAFIQLKGAN